MQSGRLYTRRLAGAFVTFGLLAACIVAAVADGAYTPAPPIAVPVQPERSRHGQIIEARHLRTRLDDGSGEVLWIDPSCQQTHIVDDWRIVTGSDVTLETPVWLRLPIRDGTWHVVGLPPGVHIRFALSAQRRGRVREIVEALPSVPVGWYCLYEEFYRSSGDSTGGGMVYRSRFQVEAPPPKPTYFPAPGYPQVRKPRQTPVHVDISGWPSPIPVSFVPAPSFFPPRPPNAEIHYRSGVLIQIGAGNKSGYAAIRDASGRTYGYFTGWPMFIDGKQTHCASPPVHGQSVDPILCEGGWPADIVIGSTRVRVYYWHTADPRGKHVDVTDEIDRAPQRD